MHEVYEFDSLILKRHITVEKYIFVCRNRQGTRQVSTVFLPGVFNIQQQGIWNIRRLSFRR